MHRSIILKQNIQNFYILYSIILFCVDFMFYLFVSLKAIQWLEDLYHVLLKSHYHVGSNVEEIQTQKEEHQAFQETAKVIHR